MTEGGDTKDDLKLPNTTDELVKLAAAIKEDFDAGKEVIVAVLSVGVGFVVGRWGCCGCGCSCRCRCWVAARPGPRRPR